MCICECNDNNCNNCSKYLSINSNEGQKISEQYSKDVAIALKPIREKYKIYKDVKKYNEN